jgi:hypothetical protein
MSTYDVVYPLGRRIRQVKTRAARPRTLDGATIGELSNHKFDSEYTFEVIEKALLKRFPTAKFVSFEQFGDTYGPRESDVISDLPAKLELYECDVVISGNAG